MKYTHPHTTPHLHHAPTYITTQPIPHATPTTHTTPGVGHATQALHLQWLLTLGHTGYLILL